MGRFGAVVLLSFLVAAGSCSKSEQPGEEAEENAAELEEAEPDVPRGLENPTNDADVVALVNEVLECRYSEGGFKSCDAFDVLTKSELIDEGAADETLVNLLEDDEEAVRWLAARLLEREGRSYRTDGELAERAVAVLEAEGDVAVGKTLAKVVRVIDLERTGLTDRVIAIVKEHELKPVRVTIADNVMWRNSDSDTLYAFVTDLARNGEDEEIRAAAASSFWIGTPHDKREEVCELWIELAQNDPSRKIAEKATGDVAHRGGKPCKAHFDTVLDLAEAASTAGTVETVAIGYAVTHLHKDEEATDEQKQRALDIAMALLENADNDTSARAQALRLLGEASPRGQEIAAKYLEDDEFFIRSAAERIARN